jgi:hypothetical protein
MTPSDIVDRPKRTHSIPPVDRTHVLQAGEMRAGRLVMRDRRIRRKELLYGAPTGRLRIVVVVIYRPTATWKEKGVRNGDRTGLRIVGPT